MIVKIYWYLSKLVAHKVTTTPSEFFFQLYEFHNLNFEFGISKILILLARSIFLKGGHLTKYGIKNTFHENPVEVRIFDGTVVTCMYLHDIDIIFFLKERNSTSRFCAYECTTPCTIERRITEKVVTASRKQGDTHTKGEHPRSGRAVFHAR
jgi:hypothetical protein